MVSKIKKIENLNTLYINHAIVQVTKIVFSARKYFSKVKFKGFLVPVSFSSLIYPLDSY